MPVVRHSRLALKLGPLSKGHNRPPAVPFSISSVTLCGCIWHYYQRFKFLDKIVTRIVQYVTASWWRLNCDFSHPVCPRNTRPRFTIVKSESPTLKKYMNVKIEVKTVWLCVFKMKGVTNHKFCPFQQVMSKACTNKVQHLRLSKCCHRRFKIFGMWHCANVGLFPTFWRIIVPLCLWSCSQRQLSLQTAHIT